MPITARLLEKANSTPNSGIGSRSTPDAPIYLINGYTLSGNSTNWTTSSVFDAKCSYLNYVNSTPSYGPGLNTDTYYYNSNVGLGIGTQLYRNINGNYNNPTNPTTGNWIYVPGSPSSNPVLLNIYVPSVITVSGSVITAITSITSLPDCGSPTPTPTPSPTATPTPTPTVIPTSSSIAINLCAPTSASSYTVIQVYAVTGSTPIAVNTVVTASFTLSGSLGTVFSGSLYINNGNTCASSSFSFLPSQSITNAYITDISPISYGLYSYMDGTPSISSSCPTCP